MTSLKAMLLNIISEYLFCSMLKKNKFIECLYYIVFTSIIAGVDKYVKDPSAVFANFYPFFLSSLYKTRRFYFKKSGKT